MSHDHNIINRRVQLFSQALPTKSTCMHQIIGPLGSGLSHVGALWGSKSGSIQATPGGALLAWPRFAPNGLRTTNMGPSGLTAFGAAGRPKRSVGRQAPTDLKTPKIVERINCAAHLQFAVINLNQLPGGSYLDSADYTYVSAVNLPLADNRLQGDSFLRRHQVYQS